jgi:ABC-type sugar transport system, periplasmic component
MKDLKNVSKLLTLVLVASLILTFVMAGCKTGSSGNTANQSTQSTAQSTQGTENNKAQTISVSYMQSGTYDKAAQEVADQLKADGITTNVEAFPYAVLRQKNTTDIVSGANHFDVMSGSYYLSDLYSHFLPLDDRIAKDNYGQGFIPGILDNCEALNGKTVGAPYGVDSFGLIYRTDLFQQAGITPPKTWDDFKKDLDILKQKLPSDVLPYAFSVGANEQLIGIFMVRYNGSYISKDGKFELEADKAVSALKDCASLMKYGPSNITALTIDQTNALFLQGKVAMIEGWPSFIASQVADPNKSKISGKYAVAVYPTDGGHPWLSLWNMFIPSKSKSPDAGWTWIKTFTNEKNATSMFKNYGIGSIYESSYKDADVIAKYGNEYLDGVVGNIKNAVNPPLSGEANDLFNKIMGDMLVNKITPEAAVKQINDGWASLQVPKSTLEYAQKHGLQAK